MHATTQTLLDKYAVTDATREFIAAGHQPMFIDGEFVDASDGGTFLIEDPSTGAPLIAVPAATTIDVDAAVAAARAAFEAGPWA
jgi:phenylacetaldehyde dehydrogenase